MKSFAVISECGVYRYRLERDLGKGKGTIAGIMVNPSTADASKDDATIRKWIGFATRLGYRRIIIGNKFAFRATDVRALKRAAGPVGTENDRHLRDILVEADAHVVAWGPLAKLPGHLRGRWRDVVAIAEDVGCDLTCFGTALDGQPLHPLMLGYSTELRPWRTPR